MEKFEMKNANVEAVMAACNLGNFPKADACKKAGKEHEEKMKAERQIGTLLWIRFVFWPALDRAARENESSVSMTLPAYCDWDCFKDFMSEYGNYTMYKSNDDIRVSW